MAKFEFEDRETKNEIEFFWQFSCLRFAMHWKLSLVLELKIFSQVCNRRLRHWGETKVSVIQTVAFGNLEKLLMMATIGSLGMPGFDWIEFNLHFLKKKLLYNNKTPGLSFDWWNEDNSFGRKWV